MHGLSDEMFGNFKKVENYKLKNGEHKFRILPPFAPNRLYAFVRLHWGFSNENNNMIPLRCLAGKKAGAEEVCPICKRHAEMVIESNNLNAQGKLKEGKEKLEEASKIGARATYIWQILTEEGQHKTMSLTYRAHEALMQKVGFWWKQKNINITDSNRNYKVYCNRTGQKAQTNYAFEVLDGAHDIRKIDVPELHDLDGVHKAKLNEELNKILDLGYIPSNKSNQPAPQAPASQAPVQPAPQNNVSAPSEPLHQASQPAPQASAPQAPAQPELNQGNAGVQAPTGEGSFGGFTSDDIPF